LPLFKFKQFADGTFQRLPKLPLSEDRIVWTLKGTTTSALPIGQSTGVSVWHHGSADFQLSKNAEDYSSSENVLRILF
jgi:hypothetical protein